MLLERLRDTPTADPEAPEGAARSLVLGALLFRWVWLVWMSTLALTSGDFERSGLAWSCIALAAGWTVWLTATTRTWTWAELGIDLAVCGGLVLASAFTVPEGDVVSGRPFFATAYPMSAALLWGATRGPWAGATAAAVLAICHLLTRPLNGIAFTELEPSPVTF